MRSQLAWQAEQRLIEAARRLSPTQRLAAYAEHCRLVNQLYREGAILRAAAHATNRGPAA